MRALFEDEAELLEMVSAKRLEILEAAGFGPFLQVSMLVSGAPLLRDVAESARPRIVTVLRKIQTCILRPYATGSEFDELMTVAQIRKNASPIVERVYNGETIAVRIGRLPQTPPIVKFVPPTPMSIMLRDRFAKRYAARR